MSRVFGRKTIQACEFQSLSESHLQLGLTSDLAVVTVQNEILSSREFPRRTGGCKPGFKGDHQAHNKYADEHMNTLFKDELNNGIDC